MQEANKLVVPFFKSVAVQDEAASKREGRPIFKDEEQVEIRISGERNYSPTFPAHAVWRKQNGDDVTYAERFPEAYARFAAGKEQVAEGTPLSELPFLTEAKRAELRGLKVYTAEALASLDGKHLKNLGITGREMKNQATTYLERSGGSAQSVALAAEVEALRAELTELRTGHQASEPQSSDDDEKEALKVRIADLTGSRPKGNPSVETLREMLSEMTTEAA